jgi:hypothetical protein
MNTYTIAFNIGLLLRNANAAIAIFVCLLCDSIQVNIIE